MQMIKIVYLTTGLSTGGAEIMLYHLLSRINKQKFELAVVSLTDRGTYGDRIEKLGIPVHTINMKPGIPTPTAIWRLTQTFNHLQPDLIQGWMYHGNLAANIATILFKQKIPIFWSIHHSITSLRSEKRMTRSIIKIGTYISKLNRKVIFVSQNSKNQHEKLGYSSNNSCVIPNGFDTSQFQPSFTAKSNICSELKIPNNSFLIGLICRYHPMKDHANFLKAAALLSKQKPHVHFVLAGTNVDHKNINLIKVIQELKLLDNVHLLGERDDMPNIIPAFDIVSLASAYGEAFPLIIGESMSCGVPCVVTDVGDARWIIGDTGKVVPPKNPEALADGWQDLIDMSMEERQKLGIAARSRIVNLFSLDSVVSKYEHLYESCSNF
jgi:glycosyltransferase involved in cell wall biosynthesis